MNFLLLSRKLCYTFVICTLFIRLADAQADTLFITPEDEFLQVRLSKFSTETIGEHRYPRQTIVLKEGEPFTGTVIKKKGIRLFYGIIFEEVGRIDKDDQSTLVVNYKNGKFFGEYYYGDPKVDIHFYFDNDGKPYGKGIIRFEEKNYGQIEFVPNIIPFVGFSNYFSDPDYFLNEYGSYNNDLGKFNYRTNWTNIEVRPNGTHLSDLINRVSIPSYPLSSNCHLLDSIIYSFKSGKLYDIEYSSSCNFEYKLSPDSFIEDMPVINSATDNIFQEFDYSLCLFSANQNNDLLGGWKYYYSSILDFGYGRFFNSLDQLPTSAEIKAENFHLKIEYDIPLIKNSAKRLKVEEVFNSNPAVHGYGQYVYQINDYFIKEMELSFDSEDLKVHTVYKKNDGQYYLESNFVRKGSYTPHTDNEYNGTLITAGNLNTELIDSIFYETINQPMDAYTGTHDPHNFFLLKKMEKENYLMEIKGNLARDNERELDLVEARIEAKLKDRAFNNLINHGVSKFKFSDGSEKVFNYKDGDIIID